MNLLISRLKFSIVLKICVMKLTKFPINEGLNITSIIISKKDKINKKGLIQQEIILL